MKYLILLLLAFYALLFNCAVFASNWMPLSKIQSQSSQAYQLESECLKLGEQCLDVGDEPQIASLGFASVAPNLVDDLTKPVYEFESQVELCSGQEDCQEKLSVKNCGNTYLVFIDSLYTKVYCTIVIGYEKKEEGKKLVKDLVGFNTYKAQKAQVDFFNANKGQVKELRECLAGVIDLLVLRNASKNLTVPQVQTMVSTYQPIMALLQAVSGTTAKLAIQGVVADGVLVTDADKTALIQEIDKCLTP